MTKRGKRRFVIFLCAAAVILVAAGIVRVKLHPPRPLHEQIADYMYHSRTDPKLEYLVEKYGDEFVATEYGSIQSTRFSDFYVNVEWYEEEKTYKDDYIVYLRKQELESILIPIAEPIFGKCKLFVISYGDCPSNYGKDTSALELLGASEEYPLVQVCVYTAHSFLPIILNGVLADGRKKMTDGTPFPPLDTLVSQKRKTEYQLPRRGRQAAPFSYLKLNTKPNNWRLPFSL